MPGAWISCSTVVRVIDFKPGQKFNRILFVISRHLNSHRPDDRIKAGPNNTKGEQALQAFALCIVRNSRVF